MPKVEWGVKRLCPHCATRFYDLQNDPMTCPSCGATFALASLLEATSKSARKAKAEEAKTKAAEVVDDADDLDEGADIDIDDDLLEDDDDDDTVDLEEIADVPANDDDD